MADAALMTSSTRSGSIEDFDYVRFSICDFHGYSRCKVVPKAHVKDAVENGVAIWRGFLTHGAAMEDPSFLPRLGRFGNIIALPHMQTLHAVPWAAVGDKFRVGAVICESNYHDRTSQPENPRFIARQQLQRLEAEHGMKLLSGTEMELTLFKSDTLDPIYQGHHFCMTSTTAKMEPYMYALDSNLRQIGVDSHDMECEYGPGQIEFPLSPAEGIKGADDVFIFKEAAKEIGEQQGFRANFMSKATQDIGNGLHFNLSLWDPELKRNLFQDGEGSGKLPDTMRYFLGGLMKHALALCALCCPTVNCYRRLHGSWSPSTMYWGMDDRNSLFRVKINGKGSLIENRLPSGLSNIYLVMAATLAAGMDGLKNKIEPPPPHQEGAPLLPSTLQEALDALKGDAVMVDALGANFVEWFTMIKERYEVEALKEFNPKNLDSFDAEWELYGSTM